MTTIVVVLIGIGVVFIASSLDCTPIRETFNTIVTNQSIDWTGTKNCQGLVTNQAPPEPGDPSFKPVIASPLPSGRCPDGYIFNSSLNKCVKKGSTPITGGRGA